jgi:lysophospholipid hydrolase
MSLDQDRSFYCVIDGMVQVFAQTDSSDATQENLWDDEDMNGYQLLNEVGSGGTLSSLFTILSLFTEDVHISWDQSSEDPAMTASPHERHTTTDSDISLLSLDSSSVGPQGGSRRRSASSAASTIHAGGFVTSPDVMASSESGDTHRPQSTYSSRPKPLHPSRSHRGVIARATVDSTLAVIPAEAFRRLTKQHPKATGHVVQGEYGESKHYCMSLNLTHI